MMPTVGLSFAFKVNYLREDQITAPSLPKVKAPPNISTFMEDVISKRELLRACGALI